MADENDTQPEHDADYDPEYGSGREPGPGSEPYGSDADDTRVIDAYPEDEPEDGPGGDADDQVDAHAAGPVDDPAPAPSKPRGPVGAGVVRAVLAAVIVGAVAIGATLFATGAFEEKNEEHVPRLAASGSILARAKAGACLAWDKEPTTMAQVECAQPHKFEVAGEPSRELPESAKYPTEAALDSMRDQVCPPVVNQYLGKRLDPKGRFQMGLLTAGQQAWETGDRTVRCGVQVVDGTGTALDVSGKMVNQDQSVSWPVGTCVGIGERGQPTRAVDCAQPHAFEVTAVVDLRKQFPDASWPTLQQQEDYLGGICPAQTTSWFGADDGLRRSGLQLNWNTLSQPSWTAGSRSAICFLASSKDGRTFTPITGSAKSPNLLIDGKKPVMPTFPGAPPAPGR
ncbi:septum formation family protein [Tsukamurella sp. 1534]|uniref:septum formation family protein n=1 Tax=Tsukamurella sp. 1534 TaxID=1151061 RepID=UPI0002EFA2A6|nr:septum formation family protein [Tsukamurella sp. 1534]